MVSAEKLNRDWLAAIEEEFSSLENLIEQQLHEQYKGPGKEIVIPCFGREETISRIVSRYSTKDMGWKVSFSQDQREKDFILKFSH